MIKNYRFAIQGSHFTTKFTLLVILGNYKPSCIVTIKIARRTTGAKSFYFLLLNALPLTLNIYYDLFLFNVYYFVTNITLKHLERICDF